jgi:bifunctional DNA-binding transcriptional regulator/antitoxin component of YhaV-PrlF toxin-antitoxin module
MNATATVTSRGQVTLPRKVRDVLDSRLIEFDVRDDIVLVRPVRSVAGGLAAYARKPRSLSDVRNEVWKEVAHAKGQGRPS